MGLFGKQQSGPALGVDLGSNSIKAVKVEPASSGLQVSRAAVAVTPYGAVKDGIVNDVKSVAETLKKLLTECGIKEKTCVGALSGQQVVCRLIKLPPMAEAEVLQAVSYQAERYIPFPVDQVTLDSKILGEVMEGEAKKIAVLLVAAQKEAMNKHVETLRTAGLQCTALEVEPFASLRTTVESALAGSEENFQQTTLILEMGASSCNVSVVSGGILRFARIIPIAGLNLTRAIATTLNLGYDEAEKMKKKLGSAVVNGGLEDVEDINAARQLANIMAPVLSTLLNEIQRSLAYYESRFRRARITQGFLTGGCANLRNLNRYFSTELGIEVNVLNTFQNFQVDKNLSKEYVDGAFPVLNVAAGLSMRDIKDEVLEKFTKPVTFDSGFEFGSSRQTTAFTPGGAAS